MAPIRDGLNWYIYAGNNPLRFVDPSGLEHIDNILLTFIRHRTPEQSLGNPVANPSDEALLSTEDGLNWIFGFQASATRLTPEGNNDSIKSGSEVTYRLQESEHTTGYSLAILGGETVDGREIDDVYGVPEGSSAQNAVHGNSADGSSVEYSQGEAVVSEGCAVGEISSQTELIDSLFDSGVEVGDTFDGSFFDYVDIEAP